MKKLISTLAFSVALLAFLTTHTEAKSHENAERIEAMIPVQDLLRHRIEVQLFEENGIYVRGSLLYSTVTLPEFYQNRGFRPAWMGNSDLAENLLGVIDEAFSHGLNPEIYHSGAIRELLESRDFQGADRTEPAILADLDLLLTDAFLMLASHHLAGQLDPVNFDPQWNIARDEANFSELLEQGIAANDPAEAIRGLYPAHPGYQRLVEALRHYREIHTNGGWPSFESTGVMRPGEEYQRTPALRERLQKAGDFTGDLSDNLLYDNELAEAVRTFQRRHGLDADGVIGPRTMAELNVTAQERLIQVFVNLERWRWLPQHLGDRHIRVNIANFMTEVVENDKVVASHRSIVGRQYRQTPVFSGRMTYLVLSPFWHIPPGIATRDVLPRVRENVDYLRQQNMQVLDGWGSDARVLDPATVDWSKITASNLRYRFRQNPGPNNALGDVKFMFPNRWNVYLHDTPGRELFQRTERDFSSGCIRVDRPLELARYLLQGQDNWNERTIAEAVNRRTERTVVLRNPIMVHLLYWTAWADDDGLVQFRRDIYQRDERLRAAIRETLFTPLATL